MRSKPVLSAAEGIVRCLPCLVFVATAGTGIMRGAHGQAPPREPAAQGGQNKTPGRPAAPPFLFGQVVAVRGNVLQMRTMGDEGLTRVILASNAVIVREEKLTPDVLKAGVRVMGAGRQIEGTGVGATPIKVEVHTLTVLDGGMGGGFFGGGGGPLMRGQRAEVFRKQNYSGDITFNGQVKSINPLVLADDQGNPLPVLLSDDLAVVQRRPRPIKEGDIHAGAGLMARGEPGPDGLLNARMIMLFREGGERESLSGTIMGVNDKGLTVRPRFEPRDLQIEVAPTAKIYLQEALDLDSVQIGDTLAFTGRVTGGSVKSPTTLALRTIAPADGETPALGSGGGPFGGRSMTATVKGRVLGFAPLRVQTEEGRTITIKVPGQVSYVRYRALDRSTLKTGQKAIFFGQNKEGNFVADVVVVTPSFSMGFGF